MPQPMELARTAATGGKNRSKSVRTPAMINVSTAGANTATRNKAVPVSSASFGCSRAGSNVVTIAPSNMLGTKVVSHATGIARMGRRASKIGLGKK